MFARNISFLYKLLRLNALADHSQLNVRLADHGADYRGKKVPLSITFVTTWHCNLNCIHCGSEINNKKEDKLKTARFLEIIDEMANAGVAKVGFTGGEPLMRKDMPQLIDRCASHNLVTHLVSNSWLVPKHIKTLKKLSLLMLSLDGDRQANDLIRGEGNWDKFVEAIKVCKDNGINVAGLTNLNGANAHMFSQMPAIFEDLDIPWYTQIFYDDYGVGDNANLSKDKRITGSNLGVSDDEAKEIVNQIRNSKNLLSTQRFLDFMEGQHRPISKCYAGISYAIVTPDGEMYPCNPADFDNDFAAVNLIDTEFSEAFSQLKLYRTGCATCTMGCHEEPNYLFSMRPSSLYNAYRATTYNS